MRTRTWQLALALLLAIADSARALDIQLVYKNGSSDEPAQDASGSGLISLFQYAANYYEGIFEDSHTLTINFWYDDLDDNDLGSHELVSFDGLREDEGDIRIDNQTAWFIDPTPTSDIEFNMQQTLWSGLNTTQQADWYTVSGGNTPSTLETGFAGGATAGGGAAGLSDMLSVVLHEVGHALGMSSSNGLTVLQTSDGDYDFNPNFVYGQAVAIETANNSGDDNANIAHVENTNALMTPLTPNGTRRRPSHSDLFAMAAGGSFSQLDVPRREMYGSGSWHDPANWSGNQVPEFNDDVTVRSLQNGNTATLGANGAANNLTVTTVTSVLTSSFKLDVSNRVNVSGSGALISIGTAGELEAIQVDLTTGGDVTMAAGTLDTAQLTLDPDSSLTSVLGSNSVLVSNLLVNSGTLEALSGSTLIFNSTASNPWDLDGGVTGEVRATSGDIIFDSGGMQGAFTGLMRAGAGHYIRFDEPWMNHGDLVLVGGNDFTNRARITGGTITQNSISSDLFGAGLTDIDAGINILAGEVEVQLNSEMNLNGAVSISGGDFLVKVGSVMDINGPLTISGGTFDAAGPGIAGHIEFDGPTTYNGGTIHFEGVIYQRGHATVANATTIQQTTDAAHFDMDGTAGATVWTINAPLNLYVDGIEDVATNNIFSGTISIHHSGVIGVDGGTLDMNLPAGENWRISNTLNLDGSVPSTFPFFTIIPTMVSGSDVNVTGTLNMQDRGAISARLDLAGTLNLLDAGSSLTLTGGNFGSPNRLNGGLVNGPGTLRATHGHSLEGYGTINADIEFVDSTLLRADDGQLIINGTIQDVSKLGTADTDGVLNITNVWNTNVADVVEMLGGSILGASIINGTVLDPGQIIGFGTLAPNQIVNDGTIGAVGGTLVINTTLNPDLDGGGSGGVIEANLGDLLILDAVTDLFDGTANVGAGRAIIFNGGWTLASGTLNLNGGVDVVNAATIGGASQTLHGTVNVDEKASFNLPTTFAPTVLVNLLSATDNLRLNEDATVQAGAGFLGLGGLKNVAGSTLTLEDGADIAVLLENEGVLEIGASPGLATVEAYMQGLGTMHIELGGLTPGTGYDQLTVLGDTTLAGTLAVSLLGQFVPTLNDVFDVIAFEGNLTGGFTDVSVPTLSGLALNLLYESTTIRLRAQLPGDLNGDGFVGIDDLNTVLSQWNQHVDAGVWLGGDPSGDGFVGIDDLNAVLSNWNAGTPPGAPTGEALAAIPEPGTLVLSLLGGLTISRRTRRAS